MLCLAQLTRMLPGYSSDSSKALMLGTESLTGWKAFPTEVDWDGVGAFPGTCNSEVTAAQADP